MKEAFDFSKIEDQKKFENLPEKEQVEVVIKAQGEGWTINKPLETLKEEYRQRLNVILNKQLTVENIETFAEDALGETIQLTDDILTQYRKNPNIHKSSVLNAREQEDEAFKIFELPDIQEILQSIIEVRDKIDSLKEYIYANAEDIEEVITPPDILPPPKGGGQWEEKEMFPRVLTLLYILDYDFDILPEDTHIIRGRVTPEMVRQTPYVRVDIPELERVVYLCDEEGNVSYIFDTSKIEENSLILDEIDVDSKRDKNSLITDYPGIGVRLKQTNSWRNNMVAALKEPLPEAITNRTERVSEFRKEKKEFLSFEDFLQEVKISYTGESNVQKWYNEEQKKHHGWPSNPQRIYKNSWEGWSELVGKENPTRKEFLSFEDFQQEVRSLYQGEGSIKGWYKEGLKNHPNWPHNPDKTYKDKGWIGFPELFGRENKFKKEWLSFEDFQQEVKALYPGEGDVQKWYRQEYGNHFNWPSHPQKIYEDNWKSWSDIVGKESHLDKEYPSFEDFQQEVRSLYPGKGGVIKWYNQEQKNHHNWPSHPHVIYKDKGWKSWPGLIAKNS